METVIPSARPARFNASASVPTRRALVFELGIQNAGLALVILIGQLKGLGGAAAMQFFPSCPVGPATLPCTIVAWDGMVMHH